MILDNIEDTKYQFFTFNFNQSEHQVLFNRFIGSEDLPFPLYLSLEWKICLTFVLALALLIGIKLKAIIINYLRSNDSKGPGQ